ncbi:hypothetical protein Tco_1402523 [Tanacetum coccineum]
MEVMPSQDIDDEFLFSCFLILNGFVLEMICNDGDYRNGVPLTVAACTSLDDATESDATHVVNRSTVTYPNGMCINKDLSFTSSTDKKATSVNCLVEKMWHHALLSPNCRTPGHLDDARGAEGCRLDAQGFFLGKHLQVHKIRLKIKNKEIESDEEPPRVSPVDINPIHNSADEEGGTPLSLHGCENDASIQKSNGLATSEKEMETRETVNSAGSKKRTKSLRKEPLSLSFSSEIFKSLSFRLDRLCHLAILCLDQHAHTLHHLESLLTISFDRLDIFEGRSCISEFCENFVFISELHDS